jgi:hypothetical protein
MTRDQAKKMIERMPLIQAYADGATIQSCHQVVGSDPHWYEVLNPDFFEDSLRIKPPPPPPPRRVTVIYRDGRPYMASTSVGRDITVGDLIPGEELVTFVEEQPT